ncbi:hypothetical protein C8Q78DRAFT_1080367 [Trametes maxima]|nr:hypothetical protein C8Q78DRAFT_1080367 [Trametes maxima]
MSTTPRPRRSNANLHPADILLEDKRSRRSSAEVAKEKAALEAQRQAIVEKRAADLRKLAMLEEQLKMQDIDGGQQMPIEQATTKGKLTANDPPASIAKTSTRRKGKQVSASEHAPPAVTQESQHTAVVAGQPPVGGTGAKGQSGGGRLKRASRADVDAYRGPATGSGAPSAALFSPTQPGVPPMATPAAPKPSANGRKLKRRSENNEQGLEFPQPKKGKMTKLAGVTPAAASKFSSPLLPRQTPATTEQDNAIQHTPAKPGAPTAHSTHLSPPAAFRTPRSSVKAKTASTSPGVSGSNTVATDIASSEAVVSVGFGGYVPADDDEAIEQGPELPNVGSDSDSETDSETALAVTSTRPMKGGILAVEIVDVAASSAPKHPLLSTVTSVTTGASDAASVLPSALRKGARHWVMADIEKLLGPYAGNFTLIFLPKLIYLVGNSATGPWRLYGVDLPSVMKGIATDIFPTLIATIEPEIVPRRMFYEVAKQKLSEYRNGVAKEALDVVNEYMQSRRFTSAEERADFIAWALTDSQELKYPFRYVRVFTNPRDGTLEKIDVYQGKLIACTFSYHLRRTGLRADQFRDYPCNALALATTAIERALRMWETGWLKRPNPRSEEAKFSDRSWGKTATEYLGGIINLTEKQWDGILSRAELYITGRSLDDSDSDSDSSDDNSDTFDLPMAGGRADIDDDHQTAYEAELRGTL